MRHFLKILVRHTVIFTSLLLFVTVIVYVMSHFVELHPDAYRDGLLSIVYVYPFVLLANGVYALFVWQRRGKRSASQESFLSWYRARGAFANVAIVFTLITLVNSVMMLAGLDAPKEGLLTYQHMLVRLAIVTAAIAVSMINDVMRQLKAFSTSFRFDAAARREALNAILHRPVEASAKSFTVLTFLICCGAIIVSPWRGIAGGAPFYSALLILYGVLLVVFVCIRPGVTMR
ncbi:MAG: hypothetical protein EA383_04345 [Spirochaetaceae bacterium]|nr:MAG: hypothetical protein EA383_04345 [Spirochaetaceae bacterium]